MAIRAMAMAIRWRIPPENSWGYCAKRQLRVGDADLAQHGGGVAALSPAAEVPSRYWMSVICRPMVSTGLWACMGSWNTMEISLPRSARISLLGEGQQVAALLEADAAPGHDGVGRQQADVWH